MPMFTTLRIAFVVWPRHSPLRIFLGEIGHSVQYLVDFRDDVDTIDHERGVAGESQRDVQDGPVF